MNEFKMKHAKKKQEILDVLAEAENFFRGNEFEHEAEVIAQQRVNLENGEFSISVVGEFSSGKSTFLNALMGESLLPSFSSETTATVNFLRHKDKSENGEAGKVYYNDGRVVTLEKADFATITKYVSTNSDEDVAKNIGRLDLYLESRFLEGNVTLVDTPGLNGVAKGHKEITQEQIERSGAGIFMFNSAQPGSKTDFEFLNELRKHVKNVILVLNQIDLIKSSEGQTVSSVIDSIKKNYKQTIEDADTIPEIIPVSAYLALVARSAKNLDYFDRKDFTAEEKALFEQKSNMQALEDRLWKFLTQGEKAKQELLSPIDQLCAQLDSVKKRLKNQQETLSGKIDADALEAQMIDLQKALAALETQLAEKTKNMKDDVRRAEKEFNEYIRAESDECKKRFGNRVENFADLDEIDPDQIQRELNNKLQQIVHEAYDSFLNELQTIMLTYSAELSDEINGAMSTTIDFSSDRKLELASFETKIDEYQKDEQRLNEEIDRLREQVDESSDNYAKQLDLNAERERLERKRDERKSAMESFEQGIMLGAPPVRTTMVNRDVATWRGGILGLVGSILFGRKHQMVSEEVVDSKERDEYMENCKKIQSQYSSELESINKHLADFNNANPGAAEREYRRKQDALDRKQNELAALQKEFVDKVKSQSARQLKKQKQQISEYVEDVVTDIIKESRNSFQKQRKSLLSMMTDIIAGSLRQQIELNTSELELLKKQGEAAETNREEQLAVISSQLESIKKMIESSILIRDEIASIETDEIGEISI